MKLKELILKIIIVVLLIFITRVLDVFIFVRLTEVLWLICGYVIHWVLCVREE